MDVDELYGLALDAFVPERGALAKALRRDGRRDEASEVAGLRKPSLAAWVVNQLVRTQRKAIKELFAAGDALRAAQEDLLAGKADGRALRTANERERTAVDALADAARGLLGGDGHAPSEAVIERVADTLHAAALDEQAGEQVRDGRLERELRHAGLGLGEDVFAVAPVSRAPAKAAEQEDGGAAKRKGKSAERRDGGKSKPKPAGKAAAAAARAAERERAAQQREETHRAEQACRAARATEAKTRRNAERAARALGAAEQVREQAAQALRAADEVLVAARHDAGEASAIHDRAQAELGAL